MADALVIFKPDSAHRLAARAGFWSWLSEERAWKLIGLTWFQPPAELVQSHYDFLKDRPFFPWLIDFMTALPVIVGRISALPAALEEMRYELGETRIQDARPLSLRERYGIYGGCNCLHLSDSAESGAREVELWSRHADLDTVNLGLARTSDRPDHTFHLRSLAYQVTGGRHVDLATQTMTKLLSAESDLEGDRFQALSRIILGALG